jgi:hypothetical protein
VARRASRDRTKYRPPRTLLGILLLLTLALGIAGLVLAAVVSNDSHSDFTATWRLRPSDEMSVEVTEKDGVYTATFAPRDAAWQRSAQMTLVDRCQLAGRLGAVAGSPGDEELQAIMPPSGASVDLEARATSGRRRRA